MLTTPSVEQTQYRLAQHYLKKLQQANAAIQQRGTGNQSYWLGVIKQDWPQIRQWQNWSAAADSPTERARLCIEFNITAAFALQTQQTSVEIIASLRQAIEVARRINDRQAEGEMLYMLGHNHLRLQQFADTEECARALMTCAELLNDSIMIGRAWYLRGSINTSSGRFDDAEICYNHSRDLLQDSAPKEMVSIWAGFGHIAYWRGDYQGSIDFHHKSLALAETVDDLGNVAVAHLSLAGVCLQIQALEQAEYHAQQTIQMARKMNFLALMPLALTMMANVNRRLGRLEQARVYYEEVLAITRSTLSTEGMINALRGLGQVYMLQGDDAGAINAFTEALTLARERNNYQRLSAAAQNLLHIHVRRGELTQADERLLDLINCARALKTPLFYARAVFSAATLWHALGMSEQAAIWAGLMRLHVQHLEPKQLETLCAHLEASVGPDRCAKMLAAGQLLTLDMALIDSIDALRATITASTA